MSEKKVQFADAGGNDDGSSADMFAADMEGPDLADKLERASRFKGKHSLDSDEEDDNADRYDVMKEDDIEGQEDGTIDVDDGIKITPFNMRDELEEGHFDTEGHYIFKKEKLIQDSWIENIDWVKIKEREKSEDKKEESDSDEEPEPIDEIQFYRDMVALMKPKESVMKALRRLGGGKSAIASQSASARWKAKKMKTQEKPADDSDREGLLKLTGLADSLMQRGNFEIYQETYERLNFKIKTHEDAKLASKPVIPDDMDADDALDMFGADFDAKKSASKETEKTADDSDAPAPAPAPAPAASSSDEPSTSSGSTGAEKLDDEVRWEYKWKLDDEEVHGPFSSGEMQQWVDDDYFPDGVLCRKVGATGQFYSSRRVDFELYM